MTVHEWRQCRYSLLPWGTGDQVSFACVRGRLVIAAVLQDPLQQIEQLLLLVAGEGREQGIGRALGGFFDLFDRTPSARSELEFIKPTVSGSPSAPDQAVAFEFIGS